MVPILAIASLVGIVGFNRIVSTEFQPSQKKIEGSIGSYGDCVTISFTTPIMVWSFPCHLTVSPSGFLKPITFAADSFMMIAPPLSVGKSFEKSRPLMIFHPIVFPNSGDTFTSLKNTTLLGSLPFQSILL